jgi:hypothetical protein
MAVECVNDIMFAPQNVVGVYNSHFVKQTPHIIVTCSAPLINLTSLLNEDNII